MMVAGLWKRKQMYCCKLPESLSRTVTYLVGRLCKILNAILYEMMNRSTDDFLYSADKNTGTAVLE